MFMCETLPTPRDQHARGNKERVSETAATHNAAANYDQQRATLSQLLNGMD